MAKVTGAQQPIELELLGILKEAQTEVHTEQLAERLGIARHTAAKYLEVLKAKGRVSCRKVGNAKLWRVFSKVIIRALSVEDIRALLQIEKNIEEERGLEGGERLTYLEETARDRIEQYQPCLGAEVSGRLVGFILGEVRTWEFGSGERAGWIEVIGIDPEFWNLGIGRGWARRS
jgi:predicted ArsR family transcriptional regulator